MKTPKYQWKYWELVTVGKHKITKQSWIKRLLNKLRSDNHGKGKL